MNKVFNKDVVLWTTVSSVSGGILYLGLNDAYHLYIRKDRLYSSPWNLYSVWNRGVLFGLSVGIMHYYLKEPVLYGLYKFVTM